MSDSMSPNVLVVNADGTIAADFTGHVHAQGLDLDLHNGAPPPTEDRIRWLSTATVQPPEPVGGEDYAYEIAAIQQRVRQLIARSPNGIGVSRFEVASDDPAVSPHGLLRITHPITGLDVVYLVGDALLASEFPQLAGGAAKRLLNFGSDTAATNGANSATKVLNHGLTDQLGNNLVPAAVLVLPRTNANAIAQVTARSSTQITVQIAHRDAATNFGTNIVFDWLAIG